MGLRRRRQALLEARGEAGSPPVRVGVVGNSVAQQNDFGTTRALVCRLQVSHHETESDPVAAHPRGWWLLTGDWNTLQCVSPSTTGCWYEA
jgi:hypothetical protein